MRFSFSHCLSGERAGKWWQRFRFACPKPRMARWAPSKRGKLLPACSGAGAASPSLAGAAGIGPLQPLEGELKGFSKERWQESSRAAAAGWVAAKAAHLGGLCKHCALQHFATALLAEPLCSISSAPQPVRKKKIRPAPAMVAPVLATHVELWRRHFVWAQALRGMSLSHYYSAWR